MLCSILDCDEVAKTRGWCDRHYKRWRTSGDPLKITKPSRPGIAHNAILDAVQVIEIRRILAAGEASGKQLATRYKVSPMTISFIRRGITWKHLDAIV